MRCITRHINNIPRKKRRLHVIGETHICSCSSEDSIGKSSKSVPVQLIECHLENLLNHVSVSLHNMPTSLSGAPRKTPLMKKKSAESGNITSCSAYDYTILAKAFFSFQRLSHPHLHPIASFA